MVKTLAKKNAIKLDEDLPKAEERRMTGDFLLKSLQFYVSSSNGAKQSFSSSSAKKKKARDYQLIQFSSDTSLPFALIHGAALKIIK